MYPKFFGLKEPSFCITPDPQYLFLSAQHREALAHLLYGAGDNGGFVLLSGEVGTGKTTVCRAFLEQLPEGVDVALVLNPAMTAAELLHAICDEFGVQLPAGEPSVKAMLDHLNGFLLDAHARGRRPVLIIDEAQNLRPKVLEQIRLLTNLETAKRKLLQIFLIGQPELRTLLASPELRQLNQRITARFHLTPLGPRETAAYIEHRIAVAGVDRPLFTRKALKRVHRRTAGVPRLINLLCDRSLLGAAVSRRMQVTPDIVDAAAREVIDRADPALPRRQGALGLAAAVLTALALGVWIGASDLPERLPTQVPGQWAAALGWPEPADSRADAIVDAGLDAETALPAVEPEGPPAPAATAQPLVASKVQLEPSRRDAGEAHQAAPSGTGTRLPPDQQDVGPIPAPSETVANPPTPAPIAEAADATMRPAAPEDAAAINRQATLGPQSAMESPAETPASTETQGPMEDPNAALLVDDAPMATPTTAEEIGPPVPRIAMARITPEPQVQTLEGDDLSGALVDQSDVVDELLRLWQIETAPGAHHLDCAAVPAFALACETGEGRWSDLRRFDRPAALKLALDEQASGFVVVMGMDEEHALLRREGAVLRVPIALLDERWSGDYLLLWRPPPFGIRVIGSGTSADAVAWLRERLASLPGSDLTVDPARYDADVRNVVQRFQEAHGLASDGVAGPHTLIMLSNALADLGVPRLSQRQ